MHKFNITLFYVALSLLFITAVCTKFENYVLNADEYHTLTFEKIPGIMAITVNLTSTNGNMILCLFTNIDYENYKAGRSYNCYTKFSGTYSLFQTSGEINAMSDQQFIYMIRNKNLVHPITLNGEVYAKHIPDLPQIGISITILVIAISIPAISVALIIFAVYKCYHNILKAPCCGGKKISNPYVEMHKFSPQTQLVSTQVEPTMFTQTQLVPTQLVSTQLVPTQLVPTQLVPTQLVPTQLVSTQLVSTQLVSTQLGTKIYNVNNYANNNM